MEYKNKDSERVALWNKTHQEKAKKAERERKKFEELKRKFEEQK